MSLATGLPLWQRREKLVALLLLGPAVVYLLALSIYPTIYSLWIAFHNYSLYRRDLVSFAGIDNFTDLLDSDVFKQSLQVTLVFAAAAVLVELILGFAIAVLLDRKMRGANVLRTLLIIPVLISPVAMGLTFRYIFAPTYGLLTYLMRSAHLPTADWTVSVNWALPVVIFADVWQWTPFVALILLSGMQSVSTEVTEAAELDGLSEWQKLWRIVVPLIRPVLLVVVLIRLIDTIRMFDLVFVMTRGGPGSVTEVLSLFSYVTGFASGDMGSASAIAWVTLVLVNILVAIFLRFLSKTA
ncbi:MAG: multiple sugar transport system permease protein [Gammaproteobacteria bacterium]|jgi:multiple sugar transport system permease protein|nr:multiple sugar transport system permease protein [Gammaproteobacteria bacterium]